MIKALIFDFNGVIVDDEPVHMRMFQKALAQEGIAMTDAEYYRRYLGMNDRDCFTSVLRKEGRTVGAAAIKKLIRRKSRLYNAYIAKHLIFFPGAGAFVRRMARKFPLAIASGALRSEIRYILRRGKLSRCFSAVVAAEDVKNGKPHPEGFQRALRALNKKFGQGWRPQECLVFEDSLEGIRAAKKARMHCLALATSHPAAKLKRADVIARDYRDKRIAAYLKAHGAEKGARVRKILE